MARYLFVTICLLVGLASAGINDAAAGKRVALVIGNDDYEKSPDLRNAGNDARAIGRRLQELGFSLVGGGVHQNLRRSRMLQLVRGFGDAIGHGDTALFYFAGHGIGDADGNWLIPVNDGNIQIQEDVRDYSVGVDAVLRRLRNRGEGVNILILDACRNNPLPNRTRSSSGTRGLKRMEAPSGSFIAYAAAPRQVALDGDGRHGLFTEELLARLGKPGQRIEDLMIDVTNAVAYRSSGKQEPWRGILAETEILFQATDGFSQPSSKPAPRSWILEFERDHILAVGAEQR